VLAMFHPFHSKLHAHFPFKSIICRSIEKDFEKETFV